MCRANLDIKSEDLDSHFVMFLGSPDFIVSSSLDHTQVVCLLSVKIFYSGIRHFQIAHNSPCPPRKTMNKRCPQFLQGTTVFYTLEKIETMVIQNWVARWGGGGGEDKKVYYGQC